MPVTQTAADVRLITPTSYEPKVLLGASVVPGDWLYLDVATKSYKKAQCDNVVAEAAVEGMALCYGASGDYVYIAKKGCEVDVGATLTRGTSYFLSDTLGKMCIESEVTTGMYVTVLGVGLANGNLLIDINATGVTKP